MTAPPPSPNPFGADAPKQDYVGLAFLALPFAVILGTGLNALVVWVVRTLQAGAPPATTIDMNSAPALVLLGGTGAAILAAGIAAWIVLAPIKNPFRQGMLAMVCGFATVVFSLVAKPVDMALGRSGLLGLAVICLLGCALLGRRIARWRPA
ncbi:MAG: hypothetical protein ABI647_00040 [Gemmatimonadota bacterium]